MPYDAAAWLGEVIESNGRRCNLTEKVVTLLKKAFADDVLGEFDVHMDGTLSKEDMNKEVKLYEAAVEDAASATSVSLSSVDKQRLEMWLKGRWALQAEDTSNKDVNKTVKVTAEMRDDMAAQGMSLPEDLLGLELSLYLGRPSARGELEGGDYGKPPTHMGGAIREKKTGAKVGWCSIDELISDALSSGDATEIRRFVQELTGRMSNSNLLPYHKTGANKISTWFNKACNNIEDDLELAHYLKEYRGRFQGRGLVEEFSAELSIAAMNKVKRIRAARAKALAEQIPLGALKGGSLKGGGSETGSMASSLHSASMSAVSDQMSELLSVVSGFSSKMEMIASRVDAIERFDPSGQGGGGQAPCWECGSKEHRKNDCPVAKKKKAEKAKKEAEEK